MHAFNTLFSFRRIVSLFVMFVMLANLASPVLAADARPTGAEMTSGLTWKMGLAGGVAGGLIGTFFGSAASGIGAATLMGVLGPFIPWVVGGIVVGVVLAKLFQAAGNLADSLKEKADKATGGLLGVPMEGQR